MVENLCSGKDVSATVLLIDYKYLYYYIPVLLIDLVPVLAMKGTLFLRNFLAFLFVIMEKCNLKFLAEDFVLCPSDDIFLSPISLIV